jgi:hypothetical protein
MKYKLNEAKNLNLFKRLLRILGEYCKSVPATGTDRLFDIAVEKGLKILPKDKTALAILDEVLKEDSVPESVQELLNMRFANLPIKCRPLVKKGQKHEVASWARDTLISDKVKDLINWDGTGAAGKWSDLEGKKVELIDMSKEEK